MVKRRPVDLVDGQRGSVERDRALFGDEFRQILRRLDLEMRHGVEIAPRDEGRHAIHMAGDHMAAEFVADLQRPLQIDRLARRPVARRWSRRGSRRRRPPRAS